MAPTPSAEHYRHAMAIALKAVQADILEMKHELHKGRTLQADELATFAITKLSKALRELTI